MPSIETVLSFLSVVLPKMYRFYRSADLGPGVGRPERELLPRLPYSLTISHVYCIFALLYLFSIPTLDTYSSIPISLFTIILVVPMRKCCGSSTSAGVPNFLFPCAGVMEAALAHEF